MEVPILGVLVPQSKSFEHFEVLKNTWWLGNHPFSGPSPYSAGSGPTSGIQCRHEWLKPLARSSGWARARLGSFRNGELNGSLLIGLMSFHLQPPKPWIWLNLIYAFQVLEIWGATHQRQDFKLVAIESEILLAESCLFNYYGWFLASGKARISTEWWSLAISLDPRMFGQIGVGMILPFSSS